MYVYIFVLLKILKNDHVKFVINIGQESIKMSTKKNVFHK